MKDKRAEIEAFRKKLIDKPTNEEHTDNEQTQLSGSLEIIYAHPDPTVRVP